MSAGVSIVLFIFAVILIYMGFAILKRKQFIDNIPTSKIRSIAMGLVEVKGRATANTVLMSPFLNKPCVFWAYKIEEYRSNGKNGGSWVTISVVQSTENFFVEDDTGKVEISPFMAELHINKGIKDVSSTKLSPVGLEFLKNANFNTGFLSRRKRVTEHILEKGDAVYVMGTAISKKEAGTNNADNIIIQRDKANFMIISDQEERILVKNLRIQTLLLLGIGSACLIGCVAIIVL